ncbi:OPT/YSL family transporter [Yersinia ruckeri]|uniref:OPT oligopeptide transporter protein n=1 Tax=Yersinia ruckeri TaxID=29486 RepID=A0A085U554_YERRU|nr:OPT/YSL family transporter [Yersinia ruckeri]AKA39435.1 membrane protein [Yersinia ruckeri]ARZ02043.1 OPT oligopeptide transporter protein [Yersinia ruckeri]EEP99044.1 Oligopeptide transporter OPT superfamily protein [Yersinia ruckeri ATCC 29473]KFE38317.1 membrane protein [Yersinia ruckeri]KGA49152.1 OPT oligopeptide transporter family protein [Yersinia ruckeri ATCC 29473]
MQKKLGSQWSDISTIVVMIFLSIVGAIIGLQLITTLGVTPNTSIIGALFAILLARIPIRFFQHYRSIHTQNLAQTVISSATFGAANSILLPIAVPYAMGQPQLILPMFIGVSAAMLLDAYLLYRLFDTKIFPAQNAWPPGVATAEAITAGDKGGRQAWLLAAGVTIGTVGAVLKIPMAALGAALIGNIWALSMFGIGLLLRGYSEPVVGIDINAHFIPHGMMVGAGLVALIQVVQVIRTKTAVDKQQRYTQPTTEVSKALGLGSVGYVVIATLLALAGGLYSEMSISMLIAFVFYAAFAAFIHELIVGIAAMHSGWFPAFAVALITLMIGIFIGFPPLALCILTGFTAATGPAFADLGFDLKAGFILRGYGEDLKQELLGRRIQLFTALVAFAVAIPIVWFAHTSYFAQNLLPPVAWVYAKTIEAGSQTSIALSLLIWAIPGAIIQWVGGPQRQIGVLLSTGLLINNPIAGWVVLTGIALRILITRCWGEKARSPMLIGAAGFIAGDALYSFFTSILSGKGK